MADGATDMGMVERVGTALEDAMLAEPWLVDALRGAGSPGKEVLRAAFERFSRAAIEAMREPTQAMEEAADAVCNERDPVDGSHIVLTGYRTMIDAALAEDTTR